MVQIKYYTSLRTSAERMKRSIWFCERIPTQEYFIQVEQCQDNDGWEPDDVIETTVTVWSDDAERVATEFWFKFP